MKSAGDHADGSPAAASGCDPGGMLAVTFAKFGEPSVLELSTMPDPDAGPGQVRIAVRATAVNPFDWKVRAGYFRDVFTTEFPAIPGLEAAGIVDEVGEGVQGIGPGDEVFGLGARTYAEFAVLDHFTAKPAALSWPQAGGLAVAAETAVRVLEIIRPAAGQTLLIEGAAGAVGSTAAQIARAAGVTVIGTASESNQDFLRSLGVLPTTYGPGLPGRVAALAPDGVDAVFDTSGRGSLQELIEVAGAPGNVITIANFTAPEHGARVTSRTQAFHALPEAARLADEGKLTPAIDSEFPLGEAAEAQQRSQAGHVRGKIVLLVTAP
jgi:NADPH:quinone reductase-like Zn-dependent oxidoreductase